MAARSTTVAMLAVAACWGNPPPPAQPIARPPAPIAAAKPRGIALVAHVTSIQSDAVLFWIDFDADKTGEHPHNVTRLLRPLTNAKRAAWFSSDDEVVRVARPPAGPGVVVSQLSTDWIWAVSPDATLAIIGCANGAPCSMGTLTDTGVVDDKPLASFHHGVDFKAWLADGRLVFTETSRSPTILYVDPKTEAITRGLELNVPFSAITDDGSLIAWQVALAAGKQVVRWKRVRDKHEMSLEVAGSSIDCRFTPVSRLLYCVVAPASARRVTDENVPHNRLLVIDPATGRSRELASDLPLLDTLFTAGSPDGRYLAYTSNLEGDSQRPMMVDLLSGDTSPIGPPALHSYVVGWLAPR